MFLPVNAVINFDTVNTFQNSSSFIVGVHSTFKSNHPMHHKRAVIKSLSDIAKRLCIEDTLGPELNTIGEDLAVNGYPRSFVESVMKNNRNDNISTNKPIRYIPAPYIKATTERVNKILRPYNLRLGSKPTNTLKIKLCILKDKISDEDKTNCVYQISCGECPAQYIGQTSRELKTRVKEHQRAVASFDPNSLIYQHLQETDHFFQLE